jgi:hypothetical protein
MPRLPVKLRRKPSEKRTGAEAEAWSVRMEGYGWPARPSPTIGQCLNGGLGWLEVEMQSLDDQGKPAARCHPLTAGHADLEAGSVLEMPVVQKGRSAPPVRMIKLTAAREITPYKWVHPDEER